MGAFGAVPDVIDFATQGNGGAALVAARNAHIRLDLYAKEAQRLALELKAEVDAGAIDHLDARRQAVEGRNHLLHTAREKLSPASRYTSEKLKEDGASVDGMTKKKMGDVLDASLDRPQRPGADPSKAMAVLGDWLIEDAIFRMDDALKDLEAKIEEAPLRDELEALQKARLDLLTEREQMGAVLLALRAGALDEGDVWDMFGQRPEGR
jgi:hypothetical protein